MKRLIIFLFLIVMLSPVSFATTVYDDAVACWNFDETSGLTAEDANGSNDGTLIGNATWTTDGKFSGALSLDGSNNTYVSIPDSEYWNFTGGNGSINLWFRADTVKTAGLITQINNDNNWALYTYSNGKIAVGIGGVNEMASATGVISANVWYNITLIKNGSTTSIKVNGQTVVSGNTNVWTNTGNPLRIGGHYHRSVPCFFDGQIDQVAVWNYALDSAQISELDGYEALPGIPELSTIMSFFVAIAAFVLKKVY